MNAHLGIIDLFGINRAKELHLTHRQLSIRVGQDLVLSPRAFIQKPLMPTVDIVHETGGPKRADRCAALRRRCEGIASSLMPAGLSRLCHGYWR